MMSHAWCCCSAVLSCEHTSSLITLPNYALHTCRYESWTCSFRMGVLVVVFTRCDARVFLTRSHVCCSCDVRHHSDLALKSLLSFSPSVRKNELRRAFDSVTLDSLPFNNQPYALVYSFYSFIHFVIVVFSIPSFFVAHLLLYPSQYKLLRL